MWLALFGEDIKMTVKGGYFDANRRLVKLKPYAEDKDTARLLWERSEEFSHKKFQLQ